MLSDEERKTIDLLKNIDKQKCVMLECPVVKNNIERQLKIIELNRIIRKQSKEIEELKETLKCTQNSWYEDTQKIEEMKKQIDLDNECEIALNNRIMDLENADKKWEDKIKAKIAELIKEGNYRTADNPNGRVHFQKEITDYQIEVLQSLLEKE